MQIATNDVRFVVGKVLGEELTPMAQVSKKPFA